MSSATSKRKGKCNIQNEGVLQEIKQDTDIHKYDYYGDPNACSARHTRSNKRACSASISAGSQRDRKTDSRMKKSFDQQKWIDEKRIREIQAKSDSEARETRRMYTDILENENSFVQDMSDFVAKKELLNKRKRELLHKRWTEHVNEPIRKEIVGQLNSPNYTEFVRRKTEAYKEYLEHVNKKHHVFLDVSAPDEYYPMCLHPVRPSMLKAETPKLKDPLLQSERDRAEEQRTVLRCLTGCELSDKDIAAINLPPLPLKPLGRHGTGCTTWVQMPIGDIESPVRHASRRRMYGVYNHSDLGVFDGWGEHPLRAKPLSSPPPNPTPGIHTPPSWSTTNMEPAKPTPPPSRVPSMTEAHREPSLYAFHVMAAL